MAREGQGYPCYPLDMMMICIYIYIYIYEELVDFDKSDEKIKISEKVDKLTLTSDSAIFRSFFPKKKCFF